jgi:YbgC/YbaW family acyl-CoA thioester hydrolase
MENRKPVIFKSTHRATFHEIDPYGHLSNIHYLAYYNENRWIGMREQLKLGMREISKLPFAFYTSKIEIKYLRPILGDEEFEISSWVDEQGETDCTVRATIHKGDRLISEFAMNLTCVDGKTGKRQPWDQDFMNQFYQN